MNIVRWLLPLPAVFFTIGRASAGDQPVRCTTSYEIQQHLLSAPRSPAPPGLQLGQPGQPEHAEQKKSVGLAAASSLLLPGMGELYVGELGLGKYFLVAESVLWLTYATFEVYGNALRDDARAFAASRAGVSLAGKNDQFFVDIGNFVDINAYNEKKLRDRDPAKLYDPNAGYAWQWGSDAARASYREQRVASENMYNNQKFVLGAVLVNHLASAINAARAAIAHNKAIDNPLPDLRIGARVLGTPAHPHGIQITLVKPL